MFFDDACLRPGDDWDRCIADAQAQASTTLVLVSPRLPQAYYQRDEIVAAINRSRHGRHRVVPIYLKGKPTRAPYGLGVKQALDLKALGSWKRVVEQLECQSAPRPGRSLSALPTPKKKGPASPARELELRTCTPRETPAASRSACYDEDQCYGVVVEAGDAPASGVVVSQADTRWVWDLFPTVLHWRLGGYPVRVLLEPISGRDEKEQRQERFRRTLLAGMGVELVEVPALETTGFFVAPRHHDLACAVVSTNRRSDYSPLAVVYRGRAQRATLDALYERLACSGRPLAQIDPVKLVSGDQAGLLAALKDRVPQYARSEVRLRLDRLRVDSLWTIVQSVREFKYRQADRFLAMFRQHDLEPFAPASVQLTDGTFSVVTPPVIEHVDRRLVLLEGNTRAALCLHRGIGEILCVVAEGVSAPLPGVPLPISKVLLARKKLPPQERIRNWDYDAFRPIERALHPY